MSRAVPGCSRLLSVGRDSRGARAGLRGRRDRQVSRRAAGRQPRGALGGARRRPLEAEARPQAGRRSSNATWDWAPGVVKGAYARLPRYFADADRVDGSRNAPGVVHGHAAGIHRSRREEDSVRQRQRQESRTSRRWSPTSPRESRGVPMNVSLAHPKEAAMYRIGEKMFYFRGGPARFRLRHLPRRRRQAHPPAGPAQPDQDRRRAEGVHDLARLSRLARRAAHFPVAALRLLSPAALSGADVRIGRVDRADHVSRAQRQRRRLRRAGDQALERQTMKT